MNQDTSIYGITLRSFELFAQMEGEIYSTELLSPCILPLDGSSPSRKAVRTRNRNLIGA